MGDNFLSEPDFADAIDQIARRHGKKRPLYVYIATIPEPLRHRFGRGSAGYARLLGEDVVLFNSEVFGPESFAKLRADGKAIFAAHTAAHEVKHAIDREILSPWIWDLLGRLNHFMERWPRLYPLAPLELRANLYAHKYFQDYYEIMFDTNRDALNKWAYSSLRNPWRKD